MNEPLIHFFSASLILFLFLGSVQLSAGPNLSTDPSLTERAHRLYFNSKLFSGIVVEHWITGQIYKESQYHQGLLDGTSKTYALNGTLIESWNYHHGEKTGLQQGWFEEGPKKFEFYFKNGKLQGPQTEWHMNGNVFRRKVYANGVETGTKVLYPGGEIYSNYTKRDGRKYGINGGPLCREPETREGENK